jgi:hypothetical protein
LQLGTASHLFLIVGVVVMVVVVVVVVVVIVCCYILDAFFFQQCFNKSDSSVSHWPFFFLKNKRLNACLRPLLH